MFFRAKRYVQAVKETGDAFRSLSVEEKATTLKNIFKWYAETVKMEEDEKERIEDVNKSIESFRERKSKSIPATDKHNFFAEERP